MVCFWCLVRVRGVVGEAWEAMTVMTAQFRNNKFDQSIEKLVKIKDSVGNRVFIRIV